MTAPLKPSLLLVDDRPQNLVALQAILEPLGHELVTASSGEEALRALLHRDDFAVILLDVQMPGMDGFEAAEVIKQRERTRVIPIIFLTALSKEERHVFRGYEVGAVDYVFKPFDPEILRAKVGVFVELWEKNHQIRAQAEQLAAQELAELRRTSAERYRQLADAMPQIVWTSDTAGAATYYNRRWFEYTGMTEDEIDEHAWTRVTHPDDLPEVVARREQTLADGNVFEVEYRFRAADGSYHWHLGRAVPIHTADGEIDFWIGTATDIDDRKRIEEAQRFLLDAGAELSRSLDWRAGLRSVARLAVPRIADWCAVHTVERDGAIATLAVEHADPAKAVFARELQERYPPSLDNERGAGAVISSGRPQLIPEVAADAFAAVAQDEVHERLLRELGLRSFLCVPIVARGQSLGAITLVTAESGRRFREDDLRALEELALRAAAVIESAQLYEEVEQRARAARALETIADGVVLLDIDERVLLWNNAAEATTGIAAADIVGRFARDVLPGYAENVAGVHVDGRPQTVPLEIGGRELWLSFSGVRFEGGTVYAFRDLTEERALEQMRSDFVATVSHELRTPLAAIYGAAVTLRREDLELGQEMQHRLLQVVADESDRLAQIVNDVLLASHLDSGQLHLQIETVDPARMTANVVEAAQTHLPDGVTLAFEAPRHLPPVAADEQQLRQVLVNLVENAVKYSPDGGPVEVRLSRAERSIRWAISDEGLGIPASERRRVFEKFYRLDPNMSQGIGGTGLGLYICRELVRRLEGRIWVEGREGKGSTFYVEIPSADRPSRKHPREKTAA
ncbi:MAG TPA: ATP-binding protein [Gaiellaceae bacterium]|nr:ATP-binding protein [Gaiellaceae bacterium]